MKSNILKTPTKKMSHEQWLKFRMNGIGGSEVAAVLGLNPYTPAVQVFYEKATQEVQNIQNERMFWGSVHEDTIANVWQYYDPAGSIDDMMRNYENGTIIRKCKKVNAIIQNEKYPQLLANLDRLISKSMFNNQEGILEIKTISDFAVNQWESGIPPYHIVQLQAYLMIAEMPYGEIAMLKNGRNFEVIPFQANPEIQEGINLKTAEFWQRVLEARQILTEGGSIEHLEPAADNSEAYEKFMKERFKSKPVTIQGTELLYETAKAEKECNAKINDIEKIKQLHKNILLSELREAEKIDFGLSKGYVSWQANSKGTRVFLNKVK